jgi:hypothetical protein
MMLVGNIFTVDSAALVIHAKFKASNLYLHLAFSVTAFPPQHVL